MNITSPAFAHDGRIPALYTCDGESISPPLHFSEIPSNTKSLVLTMDDPDVPVSIRADGNWDHWIVWNMPPETAGIDENSIPTGTIGRGTSGKALYAGPCPPDREHRYFFRLYALDTMLTLQSGATKKELLAAMKGHIIAQSELIGRYART